MTHRSRRTSQRPVARISRGVGDVLMGTVRAATRRATQRLSAIQRSLVGTAAKPSKTRLQTSVKRSKQRVDARKRASAVPSAATSTTAPLAQIFHSPGRLWNHIVRKKQAFLYYPRASWKRKVLRVASHMAFWVGLAVVLATGGVLLYILRDLPSPRMLLNNKKYAVSTQIFDRNNKLLYEIFADENRIPIKLNTLPPYVYQASIAIEDQNFFTHFGFDIQGIVRALRNTAQGKRLEGGSTITQQLVKYALLTPERSLQRKAKEIVLSIATEVIYSKEEILEMYLNYISYGGTAVGIESASQRYFKKHAKDLSIAEAALLAGLPQSPTEYSPFGSNPERAKERQREVLRRMAEDHYITSEQEQAAREETLRYALSKTDIQAPHFVFYVRDELIKKYGEEKVEKGGLRVYTTLDLDLQNTLQATLSAEVSKLAYARVGNGAAMVTKPNTGEIIAMIGSKDYFDTKNDGQVNVALAQRQPGSSVKPLMYATAFQYKLLNPGTMLLDVPTCFTIPGQKPYCPKNYDGSFRGAIDVRHALGNSLNIPAVKALKLIGVERFMQQATAMGITTWTDPSRYGLSLTLGGGEVRMIDHAQAFGTLANQGVKVPLTPFLRIEDYTGHVYEELKPEDRLSDLQALNDDEDISEQNGLERVMNRAPAYLVTHIMQDNSARSAAFGPNSKLIIKNQVVSVKTGTTNDLKDNWTVGFTPEYLIDVWVGNNDGSPMNRNLVSGVTGAAPIFHDMMTYLLNNKEPRWEEKPSDVTSAKVCASGFPQQGKEACDARVNELFWKRSMPTPVRYVAREMFVRPETGQPPKPGESTDGLVLQTKMVLSDPVAGDYCLDCTLPPGADGKLNFAPQTVEPNLPIPTASP